MNLEFLATVAMIAPDPTSSRKLYVEALGLPLQGEDDGYQHSEQIAACKSFGICLALRPRGRASEPTGGRWSGRSRRSASSLTSTTLLPSLLPQGISSRPAMRFCMKRTRSHGSKPSPGFSLPRARSSASRTRPCCTTDHSDGRSMRGGKDRTALPAPQQQLRPEESLRSARG